MSISFTEAFDYYVPLTGKLPEHLKWQLGHVEQQALWFVKDRSAAELKAVLVQADHWLRFHVLNLNVGIIRKFRERLDEGVFTTDSMLLFYSREDLELSEIETVEKLTWSEFFAVLALAKLGMVVTIETKPFIYDPKPKDEIAEHLQRDQSGFYSKHKKECMLESVESIAYAHAIFLEEEKKRKDIARGKASGKTKRKNYHPQKQYVIDQYNKLDPSIKDRPAAAMIYENMPDELKFGFQTDEPENTIKSWFLKYRRGQLKDIVPYPPTRT